jgi:hypothetical protein
VVRELVPRLRAPSLPPCSPFSQELAGRARLALSVSWRDLAKVDALFHGTKITPPNVLDAALISTARAGAARKNRHSALEAERRVEYFPTFARTSSRFSGDRGIDQSCEIPSRFRSIRYPQAPLRQA